MRTKTVVSAGLEAHTTAANVSHNSNQGISHTDLHMQHASFSQDRFPVAKKVAPNAASH